MTKKPIVADEEITAEKALEIMYTNKIERLPVVNNKGKLLGIITMQDILEKRQYPLATRDTKGNLRCGSGSRTFDFPVPNYSTTTTWMHLWWIAPHGPQYKKSSQR